MPKKKENILNFRCDKDNLTYIIKLKKRYWQSKKYGLGRLINHLIRQHRKSEKEENVSYRLKIELFESIEKRDEAIKKAKEKAILYEASKEK